MSFRRFLYLVSDVECIDGSCSLRRIDTSRLFFRASTPTEWALPVPLDSGGGGRAGATDPSAAHDGGRLPDPVINLYSPILPREVGGVGFLLFKNKAAMGGQHEHDKVVVVDRTGCSFMCDPEDLDLTVRTLPAMTAPKFSPFSLTVGESLYVLDRPPVPSNGGQRHSFEVLSLADHRIFRGIKDWCWRHLDPPPLVELSGNQYHSVDSYAVDATATGGGGGILVSNNASKLTYRYDTASSAWSKAGDWVLPFTGLAEYLPEHKLWFGISRMEDGNRFCAAAAAGGPVASSVAMEKPPVVRGVWKEYAEPPPEWSPAALCYAVYLGSSKFCIVRFFYTGKVYVCPESHHSYKREEDLHVVITGVEVQGCGGRDGDGDVQVVRHKSERYKVDVKLLQTALRKVVIIL